jgi:hypothetical protein
VEPTTFLQGCAPVSRILVKPTTLMGNPLQESTAHTYSHALSHVALLLLLLYKLRHLCGVARTFTKSGNLLAMWVKMSSKFGS